MNHLLKIIFDYTSFKFNKFCTFAQLILNNVRKVSFVFFAILLWVACDNNLNTKKSTEIIESLSILDDSIVERSPQVPEMIRQGLANAHDSIEWYSYYIRWAAYYTLSSTPDTLLTFTRKTINFAENKALAKSVLEQRRLNTLLGSAYELEAGYYQHYMMLTDTVVKLRQNAIELTKRGEMPENLPLICGNMADVCSMQNNLPEASAWYRKALQLADSLHSGSEVKTSLFMGLGRIYTSLSDFENAKIYYEQVEKNLDNMPPHEKLYFLNNYGNYFYYQKDYPAALEKFKQMESELHKIKGEDTFEMYLCLVNMGDVYLNLGETEKALECIDKAEPFFREKMVSEGVYYCQVIRFGVAVSKNDFKEAERLLPLVTANKKVQEGITNIRNRYVFDYYQKTGQTDKALSLLQRSDEIEDSIVRNKIRMRASEIMMRMSEDTLRLRHQLEMAEQKAATQRAYTGMAILAIIVIVLIALIRLWWGQIKKRQTLQEINLLKLRLLGVRQRVSPHFVFNVLNHRIAHADAQEEKEIMKLVKLIRANLDMSQNVLIPLSEELKFVKDYVSLERELMDNLQYTVDVDPKAKVSEMIVPSMFVQILAENAIKHGLKGLKGKKKLNIKVEMQEKSYRVIVTDNGRGCDCRAVNGSSTGNGLSIIRQTIDVFNIRNQEVPMLLDIRTLTDDGGQAAGCEATLTVPLQINDLSQEPEQD